MVARLQVKASQIGKLLQTLDKKDVPDHSKKGQMSKQKSETSGPPMKKPHYVDPIPPFNANKIRKSPSVTMPNEPLPTVTATTTTAKVDASAEATNKL